MRGGGGGGGGGEMPRRLAHHRRIRIHVNMHTTYVYTLPHTLPQTHTLTHVRPPYTHTLSSLHTHSHTHSHTANTRTLTHRSGCSRPTCCARSTTSRTWRRTRQLQGQTAAGGIRRSLSLCEAQHGRARTVRAWAPHARACFNGVAVVSSRTRKKAKRLSMDDSSEGHTHSVKHSTAILTL